MAILTQSHIADRGSEIALVDETHSVTWAELDERVNRLVNGLRSHGLVTGDTIAVIAGNQCEWFEIAMACAHGGWTYVPVNWHWVADELAYVYADAEPKAMIVDQRFDATVSASLKDDRAKNLSLVVGIGTTSDAAVRNDSRFIDFETSGPTY